LWKILGIHLLRAYAVGLLCEDFYFFLLMFLGNGAYCVLLIDSRNFKTNGEERVLWLEAVSIDGGAIARLLLLKGLGYEGSTPSLPKTFLNFYLDVSQTLCIMYLISVMLIVL
jgi:hypothetical protein